MRTLVGGGFEDLDAEPVRAGVGRGQDLVLHDRPGACRRGDVHRHGRAGFTGQGGAPALQPLGQHIVRSLLPHQAVVDAGVSAGRVGAAEQPAPGQRPQRPAGEFHPLPTGSRRRGRTGRPLRPGPRTRRSASRGMPARHRRARPAARMVSASTAADRRTLARAVGVDVVAQHQRAVKGSEPAGDGGDITGQVEAGALARGPRRRPRAGAGRAPARRREPGASPRSAVRCPGCAPRPGDGAGQQRSPGRPSSAAGKEDPPRRLRRARRPCAPGRRSHSGCAATVRTAAAHDGSITPSSTHASSLRSRASPRSRVAVVGQRQALVRPARPPAP